jgi:hypothetical protein
MLYLDYRLQVLMGSAEAHGTDTLVSPLQVGTPHRAVPCQSAHIHMRISAGPKSCNPGQPTAGRAPCSVRTGPMCTCHTSPRPSTRACFASLAPRAPPASRSGAAAQPTRLGEPARSSCGRGLPIGRRGAGACLDWGCGFV